MTTNEHFFEWSSEFSVNHHAIDEQHQELIEILNRLFLAVAEREGHKVTLSVLDSLLNYTQTHFAYEENVLREANYSDLEVHVQEHKKLGAELNELVEKYMIEGTQIYFELLRLLRKWLKKHIQGSDMNYRDVLAAH
jgi:hemerythrin